MSISWLSNQSTLLSTGYAFYNRLVTDARVLRQKDKNDSHGQILLNLYHSINKKINSICSAEIQKQIYSNVQTSMFSAAAAEAHKESAYLSEVLKQPIIIDYTGKGKMTPEEITQALNEIIGTSKEYQRNLTRMADKNQAFGDVTKASVMQSGKGYIQNAIDENLRSFLEQNNFFDAVQRFYSGANNISNIITIMKNALIESIIIGMIKMYDSLTMNSKQFSDEEKAYQQMVDALRNNHSYATDLAEKFFEAIGLKKMIDNLEKSLTKGKKGNQQEKEKYFKKNVASTAISVTKSAAGAKAGLVKEISEEAFINLINGQLKIVHADGMTIEFMSNQKAKRVGQYDFKPDVLVAFNVDINSLEQKVLQQFQQQEQSRYTRENAWEYQRILLEELQKAQPELDELNKFLVEQNIKNYLINNRAWNEEDTYGFSAGAYTGASGINFLSKIHGFNEGNADLDAKSFFTAVINLGQGMVGSRHKTEQLQDILQKALAQDIGHALFDDHDNIGEIKNNIGDQIIHVLNLDGHRMFLSTFYFLIGQAFERVQQDLNNGNLIKELVSVKISPASAESSLVNKKLEDYKKEDWESQREYSWANTQISMHFLHNFKQILKNHMQLP